MAANQSHIEPDDPAMQQALRVHEVHYSYLEKGNEAIISSGEAAVKNLFLMHGGALVAMLTFTSGLLGNSKSGLSADGLVGPMMHFSIGLAAATAASAGTYLTNYCYVAGEQRRKLTWEHPYIEESAASKWWLHAGVLFHVLTIMLAIGSLLLFIGGFWGVKEALTPHGDAPVALAVGGQSIAPPSLIPER